MMMVVMMMILVRKINMPRRTAYVTLMAQVIYIF